MKTDIVILGGGIIGCGLAERLARDGRRVVLVERGRVGREASSAAAGILAAQMDLERPGPFFELCQASRRLYPAWVRRLERVSHLDVQYERCGILYLALTGPQAERMAARRRWQRRRGVPIERWSPAEVRRREPRLDQRVRAGFFFPQEAQLDNVALMRALERACRRAGVRIWERTAVRRVLVQRGAVRGVLTGRGRLEAPVVVNCLGSWADMDGRFPVRLPVRPVRGQILVFQAQHPLFRRVVISDLGYLTQRRNRQVLVGSTVEFAGFRKRVTLAGVRRVLAGLRRVTSAVSACPLVESWAGFRPHTPDGLPILGATRIEGLYVATGHFRHGILLAPVTAALMTQLLLRGEAPAMLDAFSPARIGRKS